MVDVLIVFGGLGVMLGLMFLGFHIATAMFTVSLLATVIFLDGSVIAAFGSTMWSTLNNSILTAIPLFVLLGEILVRSGITANMYGALSVWLRWLPGGLLHSNIAASTLFAAVSGSSVATAATIGTVAFKTLGGMKYDPRLVMGSIAAGGTLGILIPPSINIIVYGAMTNTSVGDLYLAAVVPGIILSMAFISMIIAACAIWPALGGPREALPPLAERLRSLPWLLPPIALFVLIMGTIYGGYATPTEAAALAVVFAIGIALFAGRLTLGLLHEAFVSTMAVSGMILLILVAAFYLNFVNDILGIPHAIATFVAERASSQTEIIFYLLVFYLVLGCFMESLAMMVATMPVIFPLVLQAGIDPVWFGIFLVLLMELALISPPIGMNLFVVQAVRGHGSILDVVAGVTPFIVAILLLIAVLIAYPQIVLFVL